MKRTGRVGRLEFCVLAALLTSLVALATDAMLPALPEIGGDLGLADPNAAQYVVMVFFAGLAVGQILFGPLSDAVGRKPAIHLGLGLFLLGSLMSMAAWSFEIMLAGRALQGFGASGPRVAVVALVRDRLSGSAMAQVMSIIMGIFILVPAVAPLVGQIVLDFSGWRAIFGVFIAVGATCALWFAARQEETHPPEKRRPMRARLLWSALVEILTTRASVCHLLAAGFVFGPFVAYLASSQQIFVGVFGVGDAFPYFFAVMALAIGLASFLNARLVTRYGMARLTERALKWAVALAFVYLLYLQFLEAAPSIGPFLIWGLGTFFCLGIVFGNLNALAMEPLGHIAGVGSAVIGALTTAMSLAIGVPIGQAFDGGVVPLVGGFLASCALALICARVAQIGGSPAKITHTGNTGPETEQKSKDYS